MPSSVENSVVINRPVAEVFAYVDDYRNTTRYLVGMAEYAPTTKQTSGMGARFKLVKKTAGLPDIKSEIEITDWSKDKRIAFKSVSGFENAGAYTFAALGDRTTVKLVNSYDLASLLGGGRGGLFGGIAKAVGGVASKAAEGQARADLTKSLDQLKGLIEGGAKAGAAKPKAPAKAKTPAGAKAKAKPKAAAKPASKAKAQTRK